MKINKLFFFIILALISCRRGPSGLELPSIIGDNMVLQQKADIKIWGKANPGYHISVSPEWGTETSARTERNGQWSVTVSTPEAGGPYTLKIGVVDTTIILDNILIGEVWVCSGQSNMEMPLAGWPPNDTIMHSYEEIKAADRPQIRLFNVRRDISVIPLQDCSGEWTVCTPESVRQFSAAAYFFGKTLNERLGVPIGLVETAWGGTPAESWISSDYLTKAGEFTDRIEALKGSTSGIEEYEAWLNEHKQIEVKATGDDQWKDLSFNDQNVPLPGYDDSAWPEMKLPDVFENAIGDFDGAVWFRKEIELPEAMQGKDLVLSLGPIDDMDRTYFNGELVGSNEMTGVWQVDRNYDVPGLLVKAGSNTLAVRVLDNQGGGGIYGKPGVMKLTLKDKKLQPVSIEGEWKYQPVAELNGNKFYVFDIANNEFGSRKRPKIPGATSPTVLYNAMINPIINFGIKGAIWYQGEANVGRAEQYEKIFPLMIQNWRDAWQIPDFPFYFVQIAPYIYSNLDSSESALLREAQAKSLKTPHTGMVVTLDIATVMNIHPPFKKEVGERLAALALTNDYGFPTPCQGPVLNSMVPDGNGIKISFDNVAGGLKAKDGKLTGFEVAGKDGKFVEGIAKIVNNELIVYSPIVIEPVSVRYCWHNGSQASLFNSDGLPAEQFNDSL
jgi:sialate O-acetylesterase